MNRARHIRPELRHKTADYQIQLSDWVQSVAPWEIFVTMTYRWEASSGSAAKCFEKFMRQEMRGISYFYVVEQNPDGVGHHVHAVWCDCGDRLRTEIWQKWYERYGINRIEPIHSRENVTDYCAKHVTKETLHWNIRLLGNRRPNL
jgi:hypothetical protein